MMGLLLAQQRLMVQHPTEQHTCEMPASHRSCGLCASANHTVHRNLGHVWRGSTGRQRGRICPRTRRLQLSIVLHVQVAYQEGLKWQQRLADKEQVSLSKVCCRMPSNVCYEAVILIFTEGGVDREL